mgnify:CR=1 FL=1
MNSVLTARDLTKHFGELLVFEGLSFHADRGEVVTLLGPSGCGKSTVLHLISGLLCPDEGRVFLADRDITGETGQVSYMQQKDLLLPWRKIIDNVSLPLRIRGVGKKEARREAAPLFEDFGLEGFEYSYPAELSGGMRQRAALLRTYLFSKDVLLLDEPFARVDAVTREKLHSWFSGVLERLETTVLFVTHDIDEALKLSDRIYVLSSRPARIVKEFDLSEQRQESERLKEKIFSYLGGTAEASGSRDKDKGPVLLKKSV